MSNVERKVPPPLWRWLGLAATSLLLGTVAAIMLISAGIFDPQPLGSEQDRRALTAHAVPAGASQITWLEMPLPRDAYTVRLTAAHESGESDAAYGLALGDDAAYLAAAVSPLGYVAIWQQLGEEKTTIMPWQTWPHVHTGQESNEIQIDVQRTQLTVRLNRERLWQGAWQSPGRQLGLVGQSFGGRTVIAFQEMVLFAP